MNTSTAVLIRAGREIVRFTHVVSQAAWFAAVRDYGQIGDLIEVKLPDGDVERWYLFSVNTQGVVNGYCTEAQWYRRMTA